MSFRSQAGSNSKQGSHGLTLIDLRIGTLIRNQSVFICAIIRIMVQTISRDDLLTKIKRGDKFRLVETLPKATYDHVHLPGAINLPPDRIKEMAATLLPDKTADIVVYCANPT